MNASEAAAELERLRPAVAAGFMPSWAYNDPGLYDIELAAIFRRCWLYIGHESELRQPGDFAVRRLGQESVVFVRGDDGRIRVFVNACRHRGTEICRVARGNAADFRCPYHGWTYRNTGALIGVPARMEAYRALDLDQWGLVEIHRVDTYRGLVFANADPGAPSLADYLGEYAWYLDIQLGLTEGGMEVLGEPHRWEVAGDWKLPAENFCGDSSHTQSTHRSVLDAGLAATESAGPPGKAFGVHANTPEGHAISIRQLPEGSDVFWGYPETVRRLITAPRLDDGQRGLAARAVVHDGTVFPNFSFLHIGVKTHPADDGCAFLTVRVWQPTGPGRMEIWSWVLAPAEASEADRERIYAAAASSFSPTGSFEQDDVTVWSSISRSARSSLLAEAGLLWNYEMGMDHMGGSPPLANWPGPGTAHPSNAGESGLRAFHDRWIAQILDGWPTSRRPTASAPSPATVHA